jgi:hypothetical protein
MPAFSLLPLWRLHFIMRLLGVSTIGIESQFVCACAYLQKQHTGSPGEATQIKYVGQMRNQHGIQAGLTHRSGKLFLSSTVVHSLNVARWGLGFVQLQNVKHCQCNKGLSAEALLLCLLILMRI